MSFILCRSRIKYFMLAIGVLAQIVFVTAGAEMVVVTHPATAVDRLKSDELRQLWLSETRHIDHVRFRVMDWPEHTPLRDQFYLKVVGKTANQLKAFWAKAVFMGQGFPPKTLPSKEELLRWVKEEPGRLCYMDSGDSDGTVKVIWKDSGADNKSP